MTKEEPDQYLLKRKKKRRRIILAVLLSVLVILGLFALKILLICTAKPTISVDYAAELNRISKPPNYDPNRDAAYDYQRAAKAFVNMPVEVLNLVERQPKQITDSDNAHLIKWLSDSEPALSHLERGSRKPYLWLKADSIDRNGWVVKLELGELEPQFSLRPVRRLVDGLIWRSKLSIMRDKPDSAIQDLLTIHRVGTHLADQHEAPIIGWGMKYDAARMSFELIDSTKFDAELLESFQNQLEGHLHSSNQTRLVDRETILTLNMIQRIFTDDGKGNGHLIPNQNARELVLNYLEWKRYESNPGEGILQQLFEFEGNRISELDACIEAIRMGMFGPDRQQVIESVNNYFDYAGTLAEKTPWQLHHAGHDNDEEFSDKTDMQFVIRGHWSLRELLRPQTLDIYGPALVTTLAILRYKTETGHPPDDLRQLMSSGHLEHLPMDPYSNKPLVYKRMAGNFQLYSIGQNFKDDGSPEEDYVFWPVKKRE